MFVKLSIETNAGDELADAQDEQRHARPAMRSRSPRGRRPRPGSPAPTLMDEPARTVGRGPLEHLGTLAAARLYRNDRQIKQVSYREAESGQAGYTITIRPLSSL